MDQCTIEFEKWWAGQIKTFKVQDDTDKLLRDSAYQIAHMAWDAAWYQGRSLIDC